MSEHTGGRPQAAPGQPAPINVVLDQCAGTVRRRADREGSQAIDVDLLPAMEALLREAEERGVAVTVLIPGLRDTDVQQQLARFLAPAGGVLALDALVDLGDRHDRPRPVVAAADRVLRQMAADRGYQPVPHPAAALGAAQGTAFMFVCLTGEREALAHLPKLIPYLLERVPDGTWRVFGALPAASVGDVIALRLALECLPLDPGVEDALLVHLDNVDHAIGRELAEHKVLWADGHRVLLALDAATPNDAIRAHGAHGHFNFLTPSPELIPFGPSLSGTESDSGQTLINWITTHPTLQDMETNARGAVAVTAAIPPCPTTAASFTADVGKYAGSTPLDGAGPIVSRHSSHSDNTRVVQALQEELTTIGYAPYTHSFSFGGRTLNNVVADLPGVGYFQPASELRDRLREALLEHSFADHPAGQLQRALSSVLGGALPDQERLAALPARAARRELERMLGFRSWLPWWGDQPLPGLGAELVIVGCHLDSTAARDPGYVPATDAARGADDDASGIAATLAIARHLWAYRGQLRHTIRFCFFNAEESGLVGSKAYAALLKAASAPIRAAVCCDMIGHNSDPERIFEVHAGHTDPAVRDASVPIADCVAERAASLGVLAPAQVYKGTLRVGGTDRAVYDGAIDRSDHAAFHQYGYPAVVVTEDFFPNMPGEPGSDANPDYHRNADATVDGAYGADITRAVSLAVVELAEQVPLTELTAILASGRTVCGSGWQTYTGPDGPGIYIDVDTRLKKFTSTPIYVASIGGISDHWATTGCASVYDATPTGFRLYMRFSDGSPITPSDAMRNQWHVTWVAITSADVVPGG